MEVENSSRLAICVLKNQQIHSQQVVEELEKHGLHYSIRGVDNAYQQYKQRGTHLTNRANTGRKKIDETMEEEIVEHFREHQTSLRSFQRDKELNPTDLSIMSISRILHRNGLQSYKLSTVLPLSEEHRQERLKFARKVARWNAKWKEMVFQDETHFEIETCGQTHTEVEKITFPFNIE
ncbi:hypothetical protein ABPG72_019821 [Tetrahymena utriculariae]